MPRLSGFVWPYTKVPFSSSYKFFSLGTKNSSHNHDTINRLDVMLHFIERNFNDIWNSLIQAYEKNSNKDKSAIQDRENIFKQVFKTDGELENNFKRDKKIKEKLTEQLNVAKQNEEFNHLISESIEKEGIDFLWKSFDAFVNSDNLKMSFGNYAIDFSDEKNSENILLKQFLTFLPKNLFHRYFTSFEILTLSLFLIKKFVRPSTARNFLNNSFGSNFTKKQGVRYLEKYLLPHSGKLFIGGSIFHGLSGGIRSVKKELDELRKIEF